MKVIKEKYIWAKKITTIAIIVVMMIFAASALPQNTSYAASNTSFSTAATLTSGKVVTTTLSSGESHYYKFKMPTGNCKMILSSSTRMTASLYDPYYQYITSCTSTSTTTSAKTPTLYLMGSAYYYIIVSGNAGTYSLTVTYSNGGETIKETIVSRYDTFSDAKSINVNKLYKGQLGYDDTSDAYYFNFPHGGTFFADRFFTSGLNASSSLEATIYDASQSKKGHYYTESSQDYEMYKLQLPAGKYYLIIEGGVGEYYFQAGYEANESEHVYSDWKITKEPTCTSEGIEAKTCSVCGNKISRSIPALGHTWSESYSVDVAATCTVEGSESIHCTVCGAKKEGTERPIDKIPHNWGSWVITKEATCTEDGSRERTCSMCGDIITESIEAEGHKWDNYITLKEPTCVENGRGGMECSVCHLIEEEEIPATGVHTFGEWTTIKEATYTAEGLRSHTCSVCGKIEEENIAKLPRTSLSNATVSNIKTKTYTGKALTQNPTVVVGNETLEEGIDYELTYSKNKYVGMATVKITGINGYTDSISKTFRINPKPTTMSTVTPLSKGFKAKWKKGSNITGYELQYALNSKFTKSKKTVKITKSGTLSKKVTKLKAKKKYYVRIRTYKMVKGKKYNSSWSKYKTVTTK